MCRYSLILEQGHAHHLPDPRVVSLVARAALQAPGGHAHYGLPVPEPQRAIHLRPHRDDLGRASRWEVQVVAAQTKGRGAWVTLGGAGEPCVRVGGGCPGALHENLEPDFVEQRAVDVLHLYQVLDAFKWAVLRAIRNHVLCNRFRDTANTHELRRGGGVDVHSGVELRVQVFAQ